ncbi:hypothetical protein HK099_001360, partial [Clydaea vesicula]
CSVKSTNDNISIEIPERAFDQKADLMNTNFYDNLNPQPSASSLTTKKFNNFKEKLSFEKYTAPSSIDILEKVK